MKTMYLAVYGVHFAVQMTRIVKETAHFVYVTNWQGRAAGAKAGRKQKPRRGCRG